MAFPTNEQLLAHLEPLALRHNVDIERVKTNKAGKKSLVSVAVDADTPPDLDLLEVISNEASALFDSLEEAGTLNFGAGYTLELTTFGVGNPLTLPRHWRRNRGRLVALNQDGKKRTARIGALSEDETQVILISRDKKRVVVEVAEVAQHTGAVVEIEFAAPAAEEVEVAQMGFAEAAAVATTATA